MTGIDLDAHLNITLDALNGMGRRVDRLSNDVEHLMAPVVRGFPGQVTIPASGLGVVDLGGPDMGHEWHVRSIIVGGLTPATAVAGRVDVFASAEQLTLVPSLAQIGLNDWRDYSATLPNKAFYGIGELHLGYQESVQVVFSSATPGQIYVAIAYVQDFQSGLVKQEFGR